MSIGMLIAIVVLIVVIVGLLVPLPGWAILACIGALAVAVLFGGVIVPWRTS